LDWDSITDDNIVGVWPTPPADPLLVLLAHSDVAGKISPADGLRLADRLNELLIPAKWRKVTEKFVAACRLAGYRNEAMKFVWDPAATMQRLIKEHLREKFAAAGPGRSEVRIPVARQSTNIPNGWGFGPTRVPAQRRCISYLFLRSSASTRLMMFAT
jgi:hypothetical protein